MEIIKDVEAIDLCLYLKKHDVLVVSDFHIGFEESLNKQGVFVPRFQLNDVLKRLELVFAKVHPKIVVIAGDLKHEFGLISGQEWRDALTLLDFIGSHCEEIVVCKGNHDKILGPIVGKRGVKIVDFFLVGDFLVVHGDKLVAVDKRVKAVIIGHEHPAVSLREQGRVESFKCFLKGKYKNKILIVLPSFNLVTEGSDVLKENLLSPFLGDVSGFDVFVVDDKAREILGFGKVKNLL